MNLRPHRLWMLAFAGFFLLIAAWAFAAPYDATADEHDHVYRAVGVVSGDVAPAPADAVRGSGAYAQVPAGLVRPWPADGVTDRPVLGADIPCWSSWVSQPGHSAACAQPPSADPRLVRVGTGAGRYHPFYYAVVGLPLKLWPGWPGVLLARLISGAIAAALLAGAMVAVVRHSRHGLMLAGLLVATTPLGLHFMGAVNPNGVEIAAGIAFFAGAIPLMLGRFPERPAGLLWLTGVSALWLAMLRPTGLMYLAVAFVTFLVPLRAGNAGALWRNRAARWWAVALAAVSAGTALWLVAMKATNMGTIFRPPFHYSPGEAIYAVSERWGDWLPQMIGVFNWVETWLPLPAYLIWEFAASALLVLAIAVGRWIDRWRLFGILIGGVALPSALQTYYINSIGIITQGRYMLPMLVGVVLLAAYIIEERGLAPAHCRALNRLFVLALLPLQLGALAFNMVRWQRGLPSNFGLGWLNPLVGEWHPVVGSWTPLLCGVAGLALLGVLAWRASGRVETAPDEADETTGETTGAASGDGRHAAGDKPPALAWRGTA